jgi:FAD-linked sulfhydryl oxidase
MPPPNESSGTCRAWHPEAPSCARRRYAQKAAHPAPGSAAHGQQPGPIAASPAAPTSSSSRSSPSQHAGEPGGGSRRHTQGQHGEGPRSEQERHAGAGAGLAALEQEALEAAGGGFWEYEAEMPCPADIIELGHSTWAFLHSMAAYYPDQPTPAQQQLMRQLIEGVGEFYPCPSCAAHMRHQLQSRPPDVSSPAALSRWGGAGARRRTRGCAPGLLQPTARSLCALREPRPPWTARRRWFCELHNEVNERLGRERFNCDVVFQRWRSGPADGSCGAAGGH